MKNHSHNQFDSVLEKIVWQAAAEKRKEEAVAARRKEMARIKTIAGALLAAAILGVVALHLPEIQGVVTSKFSHQPTANAGTSGKIDQIQQAADKRDAIVNEITK